jgi:hypothetical protein
MVSWTSDKVTSRSPEKRMGMLTKTTGHLQRRLFPGISDLFSVQATENWNGKGGGRKKAYYLYAQFFHLLGHQ